MRSLTFHIAGMQCTACTLAVEHELRKLPHISSAKASLRQHNVTIAGEFSDASEEDIAAQLAPLLQPHNFILSHVRPKHSARWHEFVLAVPLALLFLALFIALQRLGIVNWLNVRELNCPAVFTIGLIASVSSCMAVTGGLTLSISANFAKEGSTFTPQALFHAGRLGAFFLLGGIMGWLGSSLVITPSATMWLSLLVGAVMLLLGLNLLDVLPRLKHLQPTLPRFIAQRFLRLSQLNHTLTPLLLGAGTFFLPCGFTQSMQLFALSTGSFMQGALSMLVFALGTLPVLALLSFAAFSVHSHKAAGVFFKTAGLIVIAFALFNLMNGLVVAGVMQPVIRL